LAHGILVSVFLRDTNGNNLLYMILLYAAISRNALTMENEGCLYWQTHVFFKDNLNCKIYEVETY
jgi:hypothetical protein